MHIKYTKASEWKRMDQYERDEYEREDKNQRAEKLAQEFKDQRSVDVLGFTTGGVVKRETSIDDFLFDTMENEYVPIRAKLVADQVQGLDLDAHQMGMAIEALLEPACQEYIFDMYEEIIYKESLNKGE